jgi:hypothetical protein
MEPKAKAGRPRRETKARRTRHMAVYITAREEGQLRQAAERAGVPFSSWARDVLVGLATGTHTLSDGRGRFRDGTVVDDIPWNVIPPKDAGDA